MHNHSRAPFSLVGNDDGKLTTILSADSDVVALCDEELRLCRTGEAEANAKLFRAAPDLLDALEGLLLAIDASGGPREAYIAQLDNAKALGRVAVAKAKGN